MKIVVPFGPGGPTDVTARIIAQALSERLGKQFYIENVPGAGGNTGTAQVARAAPDGHTLMVASTGFMVNLSLYANVPYSPKEFAPLTLIAASPNILTVIGFLLNCAVAAIIATGSIRLGGVLLLFSSGFDMLDGSVARATGQTSKFGGFFDSTVDRYSEIIVYVGLLYYLLDTDDWKTGAILVILAATGALMISYARARAEAAGWKAAVGLLARTERVVLLSLGLVIGKPLWSLWILAIGTHITAVTRMFHVWRIAQSATGEPWWGVPIVVMEATWVDFSTETT